MKRLIAMIIVFLFLGAVVNIAVAVAIQLTADLERAWMIPRDPGVRTGGYSVSESPSTRWAVRSAQRPGFRRIFSWWIRCQFGVSGGWPTDPPEPLIPAWAGSRITPEGVTDDACGTWSVLAWEAGWPLASQGGICTRFDDDESSTRSVSYWWCFAIDDRNRIDEMRLIALRPLWPGFAINTLFYAAILWLLFFAPFATRRMLRRRRGQCEKCAYPIGTWGGSPVCTECGAAVPRKVEA